MAARQGALMTSPSTERFCAEIRASTATLASIINGADLTQPVPTCPDWTLRQLTTHVGRAHRWAGEIVATRSAEFIPFRAVPDGRLPDDPGRHAGWLRDGAARLVDAVHAAGTDLVWTFTRLRPASFWARRMAHETAVHRADAEIAAGRAPVIDAGIAADGIDEWLEDQPGDESPDGRLGALADGQVLHFHATDEGLGGAGEWLVRRTGDRIAVQHGHGKGDAAVRGPASALLLVLVRRLPLDDAPVQIIGDRAVLERWLAATPF
jgi:uncharacterized protein (TIGR03083 family)